MMSLFLGLHVFMSISTVKTAKITDLASLKMALFREKYPEIELRVERR